jgi:hypothetical protein
MTSASFVPTMYHYKISFNYNVLLNTCSFSIVQVETFFPLPYEKSFQVMAKCYTLFFGRHEEEGRFCSGFLFWPTRKVLRGENRDLDHPLSEFCPRKRPKTAKMLMVSSMTNVFLTCVCFSAD